MATMSQSKIKKSDLTDKDRGWAWAVCAATMLLSILMAGTAKSLGFIYLIFKERFDEGNTMTALIGTTFTLSRAFCGPLAGSVLNQCTHTRHRCTILVATLIITTGFVASAWCKTGWQAIVTFGLLSGLAAAVVEPSTLSFLGSYFEKRIVLASNIAFTGGSLGGLILPPILIWAHDANGPRAAIMMLAGVWLHVFIVGAICRPLKQPIQADKSPHCVCQNIATASLSGELKSISAAVERTQQKNVITNRDVFSASLQDNCSYSDVSPHQSASEIYFSETKDTNTTQSANPDQDPDESSLIADIHKCARPIREYREFLSSPGLLLLIATLAVAAFAHLTSFILLPPLMEELYFGKEFASRIIMISAVFDAISRPITGFIAEKLGKYKIFLLHISFIITAATGIYNVVTLSLASFYVHGIILGIFGGLYLPFIVPLILECTSKDNVSRGTGLFPFIIAFGPAVGLYVIAALKDRTGTYRHSLVLLLSAFLSSFILVTAWTIRYARPKKTKQYVWKL